MIDVVLWIGPGRFFRNQSMPSNHLRSVVVVPVATVLIGHQHSDYVDETVDNDVVTARFRQVAPGSVHYVLQHGPPKGWRWIVHAGEFIAERV